MQGLASAVIVVFMIQPTTSHCYDIMMLILAKIHQFLLTRLIQVIKKDYEISQQYGKCTCTSSTLSVTETFVIIASIRQLFR